MGAEIRFFEHVPADKTVFIYGAGAMGEDILANLRRRGYADIAGFVDSSKAGQFCGLPVLTLDEYAPQHGPGKALLIASMYGDEIIAGLAGRGITDWYDLRPSFDSRQRHAFDLRYSLPKGVDPVAWSDAKLTTLAVAQRIAQATRVAAGGAGPEDGRWVVNLGCNDGKIYDPCFPLFTAGYRGLCVDVIQSPDIFKNIPSNDVIKLMGFHITPMNIIEVLRDARVPTTPDVLKIDIDSIDGVILSEILRSGYRPKIIQIEVNNEIPPPFKFAALYHRLYHSHNSLGLFGFYGCSLGFAEDVVTPYGYKLLQLNLVLPLRDAIFVREDLMDLFPPRPFANSREAFLAEPNEFSHMYTDFGIDVSAWRTREDYHVLAGEIWNALVLASQARFGIVAPFTFGL